MLEQVGAVSIILGILLGIFSFCWLLKRQFDVWFRKAAKKRLQAPFVSIVIAALLTGTPIVLNSFLSRTIDLKPLNPLVNGERHLTLTGWKGSDYSVIVPLSDTIVLQMANPNVTDDTLKYIEGFNAIRELDLNNTQITDEGLEAIARIPKLRDLRLAQTKITDDGFRKHLLEKESLMNLDLSGTKISAEVINEWKELKPKRRALN
jgi:hypothetical protein